MQVPVRKPKSMKARKAFIPEDRQLPSVTCVTVDSPGLAAWGTRRSTISAFQGPAGRYVRDTSRGEVAT